MSGVRERLIVGTQSFDFKELFTAYYPGVVRHAAFLIGDYATAQDVAQEVFLRLYDDPPREFTNLPAWLTKVTTNLSLNYMRGEKRRLRREEREIPPEEAAPDESLESLSQMEPVRAALALLPERDRICLLLKSSGYDYAEIAHAIGVNRASVGTILARARERFKKVFTEGVGHDGLL